MAATQLPCRVSYQEGQLNQLFTQQMLQMTFIPTCCLVAQSRDSRAPWLASGGRCSHHLSYLAGKGRSGYSAHTLSREPETARSRCTVTVCPKKTFCCESLRNLTWGVFHSRIKYLCNTVRARSGRVAALNTMPSGVITSLLIEATGHVEEVLQVMQTGASRRSAWGLKRVTTHLWAKLPV